MKKLALLIFATILLAQMPAGAQITFGTSTRINEGWRFCLDSISDFSGVRVKDSKWRLLDLPHDWSVEGEASPSLASCTGYLPGGVGWYRKSLLIPASEKGRKQYLYFGAIYCNSKVWINGQLVGERPNGYVSLLYDITPYVKYGAENQIAVWVDHSKSADSRWYTGSGIYRDVYFVTSDLVHIDNWGLFARTAKIDKKQAKADIAVTTTLRNERSEAVSVVVEQRLYRKDDSQLVTSSRKQVKVPAGGTTDCEQTLRVKNPKLWSVDYPHLYRLETAVLENGHQIDGTTTITGIRETRFDPDKGFFLNGENMKLKGVCLHHDAGSLGAAVPKQVWERRLRALKEIGCNVIRMSHNPQDEVVYDLCDELGILVKDEAFDEWEFPKRKWIEGWNVGKNPGYQGYAEYFDEWAERDLADMVRRDRNHPSIILWSIGNEVDYPNDPYTHPILDHEGINQKTIPGFKPDHPRVERIGDIAKRLVKVVKSIDTSRAVTGAMAGVVMSNHTDYPGALDVTGYNYTESRYIMDHQTYPDRVIYGSENRHEYQNWLAVKDNDHIFGQFLWTGIDYLGEAGRYPSRGMAPGLFDLGGFIKPRGYYRQSLWSDTPMAYIGTMPKNNIGKKTLLFDLEPEWNYNDGDTIRVAAFTNCEYAYLNLNGKMIPQEPRWDETSNALYWDIPFEPGELKVIGYIDDEPYAEYTIKTYGAAVSMTAASDVQLLEGKEDLAHVELNILDDNGTRVLDADQPVTCTVTGPGKLLKLENCNPRYMDGFNGNTVPAYRGRILAYVVATGDSGSIQVTFSAPGMKDTSVNINVKP